MEIGAASSASKSTSSKSSAKPPAADLLLATEEQLDDLNSSLNVLLAQVKEDTSEFPALDLMDDVKQCLECLANTTAEQLANQRAKFISLSWPADLRTVLTRLFRTFKIPEQYTLAAYELANCTAQALGGDWLMSDSEFLRLLASLSSGRLRIILGEPAEVDMTQLIACLQLQEFFFKCVEDEREWMSDSDAIFVGKCCQEAAAFVCDYIAEAGQRVNVSLHMELFLSLYRYLCAFLAIGGADILDKPALQASLPVLVKVCKYCLSQRDTDSAWFLLCNLAQFAEPPPNSLGLLMEHTGLLYATGEKGGRAEALIGLSSVLEQLKEKQGATGPWCTTQALDGAEQLARVSRDQRLAELVRELRGKTAAEKEEEKH